MNNEQCKWLMKHQYDSIEHILEYMHQENITISTLFCTNTKSNAITVVHLKSLIAILFINLFDITHNDATALAYITRAEEYLIDSRDDPLSCRLMAIINIKLRRNVNTNNNNSIDLLKTAINAYSIKLKEYINTAVECKNDSDNCNCSAVCTNTIRDSELYRQLQYNIATCKLSELCVYTEKRQFDKAVQVSNDIINMDVRTLYGNFKDISNEYAHKVMATCYRYGYGGLVIDTDKAREHYNLANELYKDDYELTVVSVTAPNVTEVNDVLSIRIPSGYIYKNTINKTIVSNPSSIIVIDTFITLEGTTLINTTLQITALCTHTNIICLVNYTDLVLEYTNEHMDTTGLTKIVSNMCNIVNSIIEKW
jgi:tetratricopeptide (TPR) repeat protein